MTSRERLLTALDHRQPDRVPIDLGGNQTGIHKFAYQKLLDLLGLQEDIVVIDLVQQLARPSEAVLQRLRVDTRYVWAKGAASFNGVVVKRERGGGVWNDFTDEFGITWSMPEEHPYYFDISHSPLAGLTLPQIKDYPFPKGDDPSRFEGVRERALAIKRDTPYAVVSGIDIINPVQLSARGMTPATLKAQFGDKLVFWGGGVDSQGVLPRGTPAQVRDNVRANLEAFKPGGGYVFNNVHNIQADVPPENVLAMFDAACEFGKY